jgi:prepilin-type N-terminal cleavage/methylation domain-containing protein/prepilin-type processing-associated H-X9-DG protein
MVLQCRQNCFFYVTPNSKKAFTLIELLVVISIISLLISILLPALRLARSSGQSIVCLSNVRRIAVAGAIYVNENEAFPPFRMRTRSLEDSTVYVNRYGRERPRWQWFFDHGVGPVIDPSPYLIGSKRTFNDKDTLLMTNKHFFCPSFRSDFDPFDIRNGAYGYNYQYLGNSNVFDNKYVNFSVRAGSISRASETVMIADSRGAGIPHGFHAYTLDPPRKARSTGFPYFAFFRSNAEIQQSPAEARHVGKANASFVDGHAESMALTDMGYVLDDHGNVSADDENGSNSLWSGTGRDEKPE